MPACTTLLGRFIQPDTIIPSESSPQSLNRFSYVLDNPINATDPTGNYCKGLGHAYAYHQCLLAWNGEGQYARNWHGTSTPTTTTDNYCAENAWDCGGSYYGTSQTSDDSGFSIPFTTPQTSDYIGGKANNNCTSFLDIACVLNDPMGTWNNPQAVSNSSKILDVLALGGDAFGEGMAIGGLAVAGPPGYEAGNGLAQVTSNLGSNIISVGSTLLTARADYLTGNQSTIIFIGTLPMPVPLGKNTINSFTTTALGFIPDTTVDVIMSGVQVFMNDNPNAPSWPVH